MTNTIYFLITLIVTIIIFIIDGISHRKFSRKGSLIFHILGLGLIIVFIAILLINEFKVSILIYPAVLLVIFGFILIYLSYLKIKSNFLSAGNITKTGIYSKTRHPMYLGLILLFISFPLFSPSLLVIIYSIALIIMLYWMAYYEEKHLIRRFGKKYLKYKEEVPMLIPGM